MDYKIEILNKEKIDKAEKISSKTKKKEGNKSKEKDADIAFASNGGLNMIPLENYDSSNKNN